MFTAFRSLFQRPNSDPPISQTPRSRRLFAERRSEFFTWFHFEPDDEPLPDGADLCRFRPSGAAFRSLVALDVTVDADDGIGAVRLALDRSFVSGPDDAFARDLAGSFLDWALDEAAHERAAPLIANIGDLAAANTPVIAAAELPPPPADTTDAYAVFTGDHDQAVVELGSAMLTLTNADGRLVIDVAMAR